MWRLFLVSLAGPSNGVVIDVSIERPAKGLGWERLADVRIGVLPATDRISGRVSGAHRSSSIIVLQRKNLLWQLKDFAVLTNSPVLLVRDIASQAFCPRKPSSSTAN